MLKWPENETDETKIHTIIDEATFATRLHIPDLDDPTIGEFKIRDKNNVLGMESLAQERVIFEKFFGEFLTAISIAAKAGPS